MPGIRYTMVLNPQWCFPSIGWFRAPIGVNDQGIEIMDWLLDSFKTRRLTQGSTHKVLHLQVGVPTTKRRLTRVEKLNNLNNI